MSAFTCDPWGISVMLRGPVFPDIQRFKTISPDCVHKREPITATTATVSPYWLFTFTENKKKRLKPLVSETRLLVGSRERNLFIVSWIFFFPSLGHYHIEPRPSPSLGGLIHSSTGFSGHYYPETIVPTVSTHSLFWNLDLLLLLAETSTWYLP